MAKKYYIPLHQMTSKSMKKGNGYKDEISGLSEWVILIALIAAILIFK